MIQDLISGNETEFKTEGVFVFIGHSPNTKIFNGQIEMTEQGYIKIDNLMKTNIDGVFAAGEAADPDFKQVVTSAGMGAAAAIAATRFLENKN
jgi:thioredoxin reductase (NADPH)